MGKFLLSQIGNHQFITIILIAIAAFEGKKSFSRSMGMVGDEDYEPKEWFRSLIKPGIYFVTAIVLAIMLVITLTI